MAEAASALPKEDKKEKRAGRYVASVATYDSDDNGRDGLSVKQFDRIYKSDRAAELAIYEWLKGEYMCKRDVREFLGDDDDEESFDIEKLLKWLGREKSLIVDYEVQELDD